MSVSEKKKLAERLRKFSKTLDPVYGGNILAFVVANNELEDIIDELDPPRPEPGKLVWFRDTEGLSDWVLGKVSILGDIQIFGSTRDISFDEVEYIPARILTPDEIALPLGVAKAIAGEDSLHNREVWAYLDRTARVKLNEHIALADAERMEGEG